MPVQVTQELIDDLVRIGTLKNSYPVNERGLFNVLGLFVQTKSKKGITSLKAGGMFIAKISLHREECGGEWEVKKYKPGKWETLVKPTLELAEWLHKWEGMGGPLAELDLREAIEGFKKTGVLNLSSTDEVEYFGALAQLMPVLTDKLNLIRERMNLLLQLVQSGQITLFTGLDIGSEDITHECEVLEECLRKAEKVNVPEHLRLHNETFLAFWRIVAHLGWVARDCHMIHAGKPLGIEDTTLGAVVSRESTLQAKIDEYVETAKEYSRLHKEHMKILEQLGIDEEITLKMRLAARN